jgi:hypothetical protein
MGGYQNSMENPGGTTASEERSIGVREKTGRGER